MNWRRVAPYSGIAFVVFFLASVVVSSVPKDTASDHAWLAAYATHAKQAGHLATGVLLVLAALSLMTFLTHIWTRVTEARDSQAVSPLPVVAAGVAAACIAAGGILMGAMSGSALLLLLPAPTPRQRCRLRDGRRRGDARGRPEHRIPQRASTRRRDLRRAAARFSLVVAVVLLASVVFLPIVALLIWLVAVTVALTRERPPRAPRPDHRQRACRAGPRVTPRPRSQRPERTADAYTHRRHHRRLGKPRDRRAHRAGALNKHQLKLTIKDATITSQGDRPGNKQTTAGLVSGKPFGNGVESITDKVTARPTTTITFAGTITIYTTHGIITGTIDIKIKPHLTAALPEPAPARSPVALVATQEHTAPSPSPAPRARPPQCSCLTPPAPCRSDSARAFAAVGDTFTGWGLGATPPVGPLPF